MTVSTTSVYRYGFCYGYTIKGREKELFQAHNYGPAAHSLRGPQGVRGSPSSEPDAKPHADWSLRQAGRAVTNSRPEDNHRAGARTRTRA